MPLTIISTPAPVPYRLRGNFALWAALALPLLSGAGGNMTPVEANASLGLLPPAGKTIAASRSNYRRCTDNESS